MLIVRITIEREDGSKVAEAVGNACSVMRWESPAPMKDVADRLWGFDYVPLLGRRLNSPAKEADEPSIVQAGGS